MRFLNLILILLMWTEAVFAVSTTDNNKVVGKTLKVASEYVTSMNKLDGSFESGTTGWAASVGTITQTASTEFQGNYKGLWSATGTGTLDLQWTATASNTYEASAIVSVDAADSDHYVCAVVNGVETGCTLFDGPDYTPNKQIKVSAVADSIKGASFYLRIKHTGTDAFNLSIDDGKIQPWTAQAGQTMEQESVTYTGYTSKDVSNKIKLSGRSGRSDNTTLLSDSNTSWTQINVLKKIKYTATFNISFVTAGSYNTILYHYDSSNNIVRRSSYLSGTNIVNAPTTMTGDAQIGDYFVIVTDGGALTNDGSTNLSITATSLRNNVVQAWQAPDTIGEIKYLPQNVAPSGFIPANGITIGNSGATYSGAQYLDLYKVLWNIATTTSTDPYYISSAKGTDAATDWAANKTIKIDESGLFTRAYLSGTTGAVGAKQADAFQGHYHTINGYGGGGSGAGVLNTSSSGSSDQTRYANTPTTDGTNGTPRTASETRPTNVAKYAFIRYAVSTPTLLALPTSKENVFSARITSAGVISSQNTDWINSVTLSGTSVFTIDITKLGLTKAPTVTALNVTSTTFGTSNARNIVIDSVSATSIVVKTGVTDTNGVIVAAALDFSISIQKQSPDYQSPGVFVGNVAKEQIAIFSHQLPSGNAGGTTTSGSFLQRSINTTDIPSSFASLASDTITISQNGWYDIDAYGMFYEAGSVVSRLVFSDGTTVDGITHYGANTTSAAILAPVRTVKYLAAGSTIKLYYRNSVTEPSNGLGVAASFGIPEKYAEIKVRQLYY